MDNARRTVTGPLHPLIADQRAAKRKREAFLVRNREWAAALVREHARHSESYSSTIRIAPVRYEGPSEITGGLAKLDGFVTIYDFDLRGSPDCIENMRAGYTGPGWPQGGARQRSWHERLDTVTARVYPDHDREAARYTSMIDASREAASQVAIMLAVGAASEQLDWDTGESIHAAATRICMNMARGGGGDLESIIDAVREDFGQTKTIAQFSRNYLNNKDAILAALEELDIRVGGAWLDTSHAAFTAGISPSTWRAYVARGTAPSADDTHDVRAPRWRAMTVQAWQAARASE